MVPWTTYTWQISPLSHLLFLRSFALDGTDHDASASYRVLRKRYGKGAKPASSNQDAWHKCTHLGFQPATLYVRRTTKSVSKLVTDQSVTQMRIMTVKIQLKKEARKQRIETDAQCRNSDK